VLVTGATGILRPAVDVLAARGNRVHALARGAAALASHRNVVPVVADFKHPESVRRALDRLKRMDAAVLYLPGAGDEITRLIAAAVDGPVVELFTSRWGEPSNGEDAPSIAAVDLPSVGVALLLGWTYDPDGGVRWHTAAEISKAALEALDTRRPAQLGTLRPWRDRPG
jgi:NAD(P)-dependent dehydrogenase (short-subunit alcohol dehydrogenase family)